MEGGLLNTPVKSLTSDVNTRRECDRSEFMQCAISNEAQETLQRRQLRMHFMDQKTN